MTVPAAATEVAAMVNARLADLLTAERGRWRTVDGGLDEMFATLSGYLLSGGKRLRPAFCYWSFVGVGGDPGDPSVVDAGAALEMLHTAALIHDDIIDGSARRHGADTVHVSFAGMHRRRGLSGSADRFGEAVAILAGDLALVYSSRLLSAISAPAAAVFEEMRLEVNVGQYLDVLGTAEGLSGDPATAAARAEGICRFKTAKYTVERPMHLGMGIADPDGLGSRLDAVSAFALPLGEAFQLKDDLLGVFGDPAVTGKPVGDDLRSGKPTLLAALAAAGGGPDERDRFVARFGRPDLDLEDIGEMQAHIQSCGARARVEGSIAELGQAAAAALNRLPFTAGAKRALSDLAAYVAGRDH